MNIETNTKQQSYLGLNIAASVWVLSILIALITYGYNFPSSNNLSEVPPVFALLNPGVYQNDFYVQETLEITPRYFYQYLVFFLVKLLSSISLVYFLLYVLAFTSFVFGLYNLGKYLGKAKITGSLLAFLGLTTLHGTVGYVSLFRSEPIPAVFAMGLSIWGIYFCFRKRWTVGYLFFGLACLIQFLVGVLPGILLLVPLAIDAYRRKSWMTLVLSLVILGGLACIIYVPMVIAGDVTHISDADFIYIYGYTRHPHHIIASQWPQLPWFNFGCFTATVFLYLLTLRTLNPDHKLTIVLVAGGALVSLLLGYIFVEVYPIAAFAKLQLARTTPFSQLMGLVVFSVAILESWDKGNRALASLIALTPMLENGAVLMLLISFSLAITARNTFFPRSISRSLTYGMLVLSILLLIAEQKSGSIGEVFYSLLSPVILLLALTLPVTVFYGLKWVEQKLLYILVLLLASLSTVALSLGLLGSLPGPLTNWFQQRVSLYAVDADDVATLARRFQTLSPVDALILTPPSKTNFRFYSQRSVVFNFNSFPYTNGGILTWNNRLYDILEVDEYDYINQRNADDFFAQRASDDILKVAQKFDANYVLTHQNWHPNLLGTVVDQEGDWVIYRVDS